MITAFQSECEIQNQMKNAVGLDTPSSSFASDLSTVSLNSRRIFSARGDWDGGTDPTRLHCPINTT